MRVKFILLGTIVLLLTQCKSANVGQADDYSDQATTPIILLLADGLSPADLESVKSTQVESMKRISRSQNQWMVKVAGNESVALKLLDKLKEDESVLETYLDGNDQSMPIKKSKN
ncbi:hypothetical protein [Ekhidna sp. To15]|uniref:hypothetical protein n=1 Tax=Ekhidna sp. To15 TaxID=3395267 RepID=UPI003F527F11